MITTGIQLTSSTKGLLFVMNDYASILGFSKFFRVTDTVQNVSLKSGWIEYTTNDGKTFAISHIYDSLQPNILKVESVNGVAPSSLSDLFDKLYTILL
jgi:hypothetical protein